MLLLIALGILCTSVSASEGKPSSRKEVCNDTICEEFVQEIKNQTGWSKPCDDFHNYVCGNWTGTQELKQKPLKDKAVKVLADLLEAACPPWNESSNATEKLVYAYISCIRKERDATALKESIRTILGGYNISQWPLQSNSPEQPSKTYQEILKEVGPLPLFPYFISNEESGPIITMTKPMLTDFYVSGDDVDFGGEESDQPDEYNYAAYDDIGKEHEEAYKEFITRTIQLLTGEENLNAAEEIIFLRRTFQKLL
uniref:Putative m13 family peptidase n=1 Tax=Amblyomma cajennense TaxID=34607 RepID=A0A023FRB1_AMBCJ